VRTCYRHAKKDRRRTQIEVGVTPIVDDLRVPDASADVADREWVLSELGRLDIDQRSVITLHYYLDLPMREVAGILDIPFGTAASRLHRGLEDGSNARIVGNEFIGGSDLTIQGVSNPLIEDNVMRGWAISADDPGDDTVIRGNDISGSVASAISVLAASTPLIEGNVLSDAGTDGIAVGFGGTGLGFDAIIRGNTITGSGGAAITASPFAAPTIESNTLVDNRFGVLTTGGNAVVDGNDIQGEGEGIILAGGGAPSITENTIDVTGRGISITRGSEATLTGNIVCGGDTSIFVDDDSEPVIDDTNEICEAAAAAG